MSDEIFFYPLQDTDFIRVSGADADAFLQAQLALNIRTLAGNGARLAPWLNARGRVTALFSLARLGDGDWLLAAHQSMTGALAKRLRMFVLRAAVEVSHGDDTWQALVIVGFDDRALASRFPTSGDVHAWDHRDGLLWRQTVPGAIEVWGPRERLSVLRAELSEDLQAFERWRRGWLIAGLPSITLNEQDRFTGHMLNLDLLGALSFDKGCYPGQEVVARTENLGRPKRRALLFKCAEEAPHPGTRVVDASGDSQGEILVSAPGEPNLTLAVVTLAHASQPLFAGTNTGRGLEPAALPYGIPEL